MAELVGGILLSAFLKVLFDRMASHEFVDFQRRRKLSDGLLDKLKTVLLSIEVVLEDAEDKQVTNPSVKKWLDELKHAVYDAEDVLDEIATKALQSKLNAEFGTTLNKKIEVRIKGVLGRLENLESQHNVMGLVQASAVGKKPSDKLPTTSLVEYSEICGRNDGKDEIINKLLLDDASDNKIGVFVIVGMGGLGKTTLTQLVYNDRRVQKHFDLVAWVCVSEEFDMFKVMKTILEVVTSSTSDIQDLNRLQLQVNERLMGKKFLLILDDIWNRNYTDWETLSNPFKSGAKGSRIIVTMHDLVVASVMRAFLIGALLRDKVDVSEWYKVLNSEIWSLSNEILPALRLSYKHPPSYIKQCFAYCSIFPKDYAFKKDQLVLLWMAEGEFTVRLEVDSSHQIANKTRHVSYATYYYENFKKCLRVLSQSSYAWKLRELPESIGKITELRYLDISRTPIRRLPDSLCKLYNLQTLKLSQCGDLDTLPRDMQKLVNLRHLDLTGTSIIEIYANTCLQPHRNLKSLAIYDYMGGSFPNWVGDHSFSNVTSIHLEKCKYCCSLPALGQLPCLQNLSIVGFDGIVAVGEEFYSSSSSIKPFGALKAIKIRLHLSTPPLVLNFGLMLNWEKWISFGAENEGGAFHRLEELYIWGCSKLMADLPIHLPSLGILEIIDCPKMLASLPRAPVICELKLANSDGLPSTLRTLEINNCKKLGLPTNLDYSCLQVLYLFGCDSLRSIPMDLFLNVKDLKIRSCTDLESLTVAEQHQHDLVDLSSLTIKGAPAGLEKQPIRLSSRKPKIASTNLENLRIHYCESLRSLPDKMNILLPSITRIFILWCANIETLPEGGLLSRLNKIDISFCEKLVESWMGWSLRNLASLRKFNISGGLEDVVSFTKKGLLPTNLINLRISDFPNLTSFNKNGFENLNSLESLTIVNCPKLDCMLEEGLQQLTSLSDLRISLYCPLMKRRWQRIKERKRMAQAACSHPLQISS
ncbi:hypothetical protein I3843_14G116600 [Carya illinoinensis]|nr:hypothetical protein I3843_14G116600 [Carya illinoinensis]